MPVPPPPAARASAGGSPGAKKRPHKKASKPPKAAIAKPPVKPPGIAKKGTPASVKLPPRVPTAPPSSSSVRLPRPPGGAPSTSAVLGPSQGLSGGSSRTVAPSTTPKPPTRAPRKPGKLVSAPKAAPQPPPFLAAVRAAGGQPTRADKQATPPQPTQTREVEEADDGWWSDGQGGGSGSDSEGVVLPVRTARTPSQSRQSVRSTGKAAVVSARVRNGAWVTKESPPSHAIAEEGEEPAVPDHTAPHRNRRISVSDDSGEAVVETDVAAQEPAPPSAEDAPESAVLDTEGGEAESSPTLQALRGTQQQLATVLRDLYAQRSEGDQAATFQHTHTLIAAAATLNRPELTGGAPTPGLQSEHNTTVGLLLALAPLLPHAARTQLSAVVPPSLPELLQALRAPIASPPPLRAQLSATPTTGVHVHQGSPEVRRMKLAGRWSLPATSSTTVLGSTGPDGSSPHPSATLPPGVGRLHTTLAAAGNGASGVHQWPAPASPSAGGTLSMPHSFHNPTHSPSTAARLWPGTPATEGGRAVLPPAYTSTDLARQMRMAQAAFAPPSPQQHCSLSPAEAAYLDTLLTSTAQGMGAVRASPHLLSSTSYSLPAERGDFESYSDSDSDSDSYEGAVSPQAGNMARELLQRTLQGPLVAQTSTQPSVWGGDASPGSFQGREPVDAPPPSWSEADLGSPPMELPSTGDVVAPTRVFVPVRPLQVQWQPLIGLPPALPGAEEAAEAPAPQVEVGELAGDHSS